MAWQPQAIEDVVHTRLKMLVDTIKAIGQWVEKFLLAYPHQAPIYSFTAGECTDVSTMEELIHLLSLDGRWATSRTLIILINITYVHTYAMYGYVIHFCNRNLFT